MREDFIHFLWKEVRFDLRNLVTTDGQSLSVQSFGIHNAYDAGPDFTNAQIRLNGSQWAGPIEMHVQASEWYAHNHDKDPAYDDVILHVVLEDDMAVYRSDGSRIPCLEMKGRIPSGLIKSYWRLLHNAYWIPCQNQLPTVNNELFNDWLEKLLRERLTDRGNLFRRRLEKVNRDWEEAFYQSLARTLGGKVNAAAMDHLAQSLPLRILQKHKHSLLQLEALLFGQSGLLPVKEDHEDEYISILRREYTFLASKYTLRPMPTVSWRFMRMRPNGFPTIRLAQLATLLSHTNLLFNKVLAAQDVKELKNMFDVQLGNYWRYHYRFGHSTTHSTKRLGHATINSIIINTVTPALECYGHLRADVQPRNRAIQFLRSTPAENNRIARNWKKMGRIAQNAGQSQALLELKENYCNKSACLNCKIGCQIMKTSSDLPPILTLNEEAEVYRLAAAS